MFARSQAACLRGIQNVAGDTYGDRISTLLVSTYHRRRGRGIAVKRRIMHAEDIMRPGRTLLTPVGSTPGILQLTCMLEQSTEHCRGHPLGWGRPEEVPQAFQDAFHSAQEEQSDSVPEYVLEDSGDESDDIVAYDTETFHYMTVADKE